MLTIGAEINGLDTEIVIKQYSNTLFVLVTQTGKIKNCIQVEKENIEDPVLPRNSQVVYNCSIKFGPDSLEDLAAVQYLCEKVSFPSNAMISICLVENVPTTLSAVAEILLKHKTW